MNVSGEKRFEAPRSVVWQVLNDPSRMAKLMPGVESFEIEDDRHWSAKVKVPLGLGALPLSFAFEKTEERPPEYARLNAKGNGVGAIVKMDTQFHLSEGGGGTDMRWEAEVGIAGPVGAMGQRVLQPIVNQQVGQVLTALEAQVMEAAGESEARGGGSEHLEEGAPPAASDASDASAPVLDEPVPTSEPLTPPPKHDDPAPEGAEAGISPHSPEAFSNDPQGPTYSTESQNGEG